MIPSLPGLLHSGTPQQAAGWTLDNVQYVGFKDFGIQVEGYALSQNGSHFYFTNSDFDRVYQWNLSTPFRISTATDSGFSLLMSGDGVINAKGISFKPDMSRMYIHNFSAAGPVGTLYEYNVPDFTNISGSSILAGTTTQPQLTIATQFNGDGTKLRSFDLQSPFNVYSQNVSVPYSPSSASIITDTVGNLFTFFVLNHTWKHDNTRLMVSGATTGIQDRIELYSMTGDDINTLQLIQTFNVATINPVFLTAGAFVSSDGLNVYTQGPDTSNSIVRQFSL